MTKFNDCIIHVCGKNSALQLFNLNTVLFF